MTTGLVRVSGGGEPLAGELVLPGPELPAIVKSAGANAWFAWEEFFGGELPNQHTRIAYRRMRTAEAPLTPRDSRAEQVSVFRKPVVAILRSGRIGDIRTIEIYGVDSGSARQLDGTILY
jgi:hypothetical protein